MTIKKTVLTVVGCVAQLTLLNAQNRGVEFEMEYTTELQTDFRAANWVNLLQLSAEVPVGRGVAFEAKSLSIAKSHENRLVEDLQVFSNIEETNLALGFAVLGFGWKKGGTELFAGVRNVNEDYFVSPVTSLFTNSSCGIFPTISANYDIANYPLASVCIDFRQNWKDWTLQASVYNGQGYKHLTGRENMFRVNPSKDGVFGMAALNYEPQENSYSMGCAVHTVGGDTSCAPWVNVEQCLNENLHLLAQGSVNFAAAPECKHYEAFGLVAKLGKTEGGLVLNHAAFAETHEYAAEMTCSIPISQSLSLQPALHIIRTGHETHSVALLRCCYTIQ